MDSVSIAKGIINLARKIKVALETVDRNNELCSYIRQKVEILDAILSSPGNNTEMSLCSSALPNLRKALEEALNLIEDCQKKPKVGHLLKADKMSAKLHDAKQKIMESMEVANFAIMFQLVNLTRSSNADTKGERKKENGEGEMKEAQDDRQERREKKDVDERRDAERKKGKKHKETQNDGDTQRENEDVEEKKIGKGKNHKEAQNSGEQQREKKDVEGKKNKETQEGGEKRREKKDVEEKRDTRRKMEIGKGKNKETREDREKRREKKDVEEKRDTGRKMEIGKGKNKETREDGEKRREKKDVDEIIDAGRKMETGKGKKNKETQEDGEKRREKKDVEEKRDTGRKMEIGKGKNKETQEDGEKRREKKDVEEKRDTGRKMEIGKGKNKEMQENGEKRREKKDVEEIIDARRKMETGKGKKNKETQEDGEKRREKKDVEEKRDAERKKVIGKGNKKKEKEDNLEEKRDCPVLEDHHDISRKEEKEEYYSCSSSCSVSQLKAMIKDLPEKTISKQDGDYIRYKVIKLSDGTRVHLHRIGRSGADAVHYIRVHGTTKLEHINISELLGYFSHGGFFYVVEEYFGFLSTCIYDNVSKEKELSWQQCSNIILYIADGVAYLHEHGVIHMSLRLSKIGIGPECVPKIYHSQISEITESVQEEGVHTSFRMKRRFAPPEYELDRRFSVKTDVYSYGVLLLELITGQRCNQAGVNYNSLTASVTVLRDALANNMKECIQTRLIDAADGPQIEDIIRCIRIALLCVEEDPALRPTMHAVRDYLRDKNQDLPMISGDDRLRKEEYYSCSSSCSVSQLKAMIKDLSEEKISKQDGDYLRYKVKLNNGTRVHLHRIGRSGADAVHYIRVRGTAKLEHINISELLGYFSHRGFFYVVEEYFGFLSTCIYDNVSKEKELSWQQCSNIILYIADGVAYLHEHGVIHMSLRLSKIGIGPECVPKIYYSQISEITESVQEEGVHTSFRMKRGFAPPEYELDRRFSVKTDVYSYGVLLLELITGQRCNQGGDNYNSLTASVFQHALANNMEGCIQPRLIDAADEPQIEDMKRCIRIALLCVEEDPALRPTMDAVRGYLRDKNQDLPRISGDWSVRTSVAEPSKFWPLCVGSGVLAHGDQHRWNLEDW